MFEYKVVPAPTRGLKARGVKGAEARFAHAVETAMNAQAAEGWEYVRAETLPSEERQGLTGTATTYRNLLVFRRALVPDAAPVEPRLLPLPEPPVTADPVDDAAPDTQETAGESPEEGGAAPDEGPVDSPAETDEAAEGKPA